MNNCMSNSKAKELIIATHSNIYCTNTEEKIKRRRQVWEQLYVKLLNKNLLLVRVKEELKMAKTILQTNVCQTPQKKNLWFRRVAIPAVKNIKRRIQWRRQLCKQLYVKLLSKETHYYAGEVICTVKY